MEAGLQQALEALSRQIRRDALRMVHAAQSGHPGGALSCADYFAVLYHAVLQQRKTAPWGYRPQDDAFFLSNGHVSAAWYSALARSGYFPVAELATFRQLGARLQGHPTPTHGLPGILVASGSLGQGLSVAAGTAYAKLLQNVSSFVYVLMGDGELQEGQNWEAAMFAAARHLDNLIVAVDYNGVQIDGPVDSVLSLGDLQAKWKAFGWDTLLINKPSVLSIYDVLQAAQRLRGNGSPTVLLMKNTMGAGVDFMEGQSAWHGKAPNDEQLQKALAQIGPTSLGDF